MPEMLNEMVKVWTHKKWVEERSKKEFGPVPSGACPKVKMGEALDAFFKAAQKGCQLGHPAAEALQEKLKTYLAAVEKKYPKFHAHVKGMLAKAVEEYAKTAKDVVGAAGKYGENRMLIQNTMLKIVSGMTTYPAACKPLHDALTAFCVQAAAAKRFNAALDATDRAPLLAAVAEWSRDWSRPSYDKMQGAFGKYPLGL
ncbi:hypothetical protein [Limnoglobus roseus]|uniref:Uncharacterized protein n=1 Tax=Limnoglobus roseus TaxID=2598579 RepID=A0A5C1AQM0_9BACT|nr:hypothetical protein [Limnoglobus roseus]QEL20915.1 hypothetical protein PX52LOC_08038 [Limnoglobus roseus]